MNECPAMPMLINILGAATGRVAKKQAKGVKKEAQVNVKQEALDDDDHRVGGAEEM